MKSGFYSNTHATYYMNEAERTWLVKFESYELQPPHEETMPDDVVECVLLLEKDKKKYLERIQNLQLNELIEPYPE